MSAKTKLLAVVMLSLCAIVVGWALFMDDYAVNFQRGYRYFYSDDGIVLEVHLEPGELLRLHRLGGDLPRVEFLQGYRVYEGLIVGQASRQYRAMDSTSQTSYFVIDTDNDRLYDHLSKRQWMERLRQFGITREPTLYKPSRFDEYLRRNVPQPRPG